jgi:hydrogenase maturation protease
MVAVFGLGNVLMGDDGLGPSVVARLRDGYDIPPGVIVEDLGTPGLNLIPYLMEIDAAIFVDTVRAAGAPGELRVYHLEEILRHAPAPRVSPHDPGLKSALLSLRLAGAGPRDVTLVGVIPGAATTGPGLSEPVQAAIVPAIGAVVAELNRLGVRLEPRGTPPHAPAWWEAPPLA